MHVRYANDGVTLDDLGREYGISYERVRQLFQEFGFPVGRNIKASAQHAEAQARKDEIQGLYKELGTIEAVVEKVDLPRSAVASALADMELRHLYRRRGEAITYDKGALIKALRTAAEICGEPLTMPAYREIAPEHDLPADVTIIRNFGTTWYEACKIAGVKANPPKGSQRNSITAEDCIQAIRLCAADFGHPPSYEAYSKWAKTHGCPSGPTVRAKVGALQNGSARQRGAWSEALKLAFE